MQRATTSEASSRAHRVANFLSRSLLFDLIHGPDLLADQDRDAALRTSEEHELSLLITTTAALIT